MAKELQMRVCKMCGREKPITDFPRHGSNKNCHYWKCRECFNACRRRYNANRRDEVRQKHNEYMKKYNKENRFNLSIKRKKYYQQNRERILEQKKQYSKKPEVKKLRRKYEIEYKRERRARDPTFDAIVRYRYRLSAYIKNHGYKSQCKTQKMIGCSWGTFWARMLETWKERYGDSWAGEPYNIDHITPLATARTPEEVYELFNYLNLQMMTPEDNSRKETFDRFGR